MNNCPVCKQAPKATNDMVNCNTPGCNEYDLKYHLWEWNDLNQLAEAEQEYITNDS